MSIIFSTDFYKSLFLLFDLFCIKWYNISRFFIVWELFVLQFLGWFAQPSWLVPTDNAVRERSIMLKKIMKVYWIFATAILLGMTVITLMLGHVSAWAIAAFVAVAGLISYYSLSKKLGTGCFYVSGGIVACKLLFLLLGGIGWVWRSLGIFKYAIVLLGFVLFIRWLIRR